MCSSRASQPAKAARDKGYPERDSPIIEPKFDVSDENEGEAEGVCVVVRHKTRCR